MRKLIIFLVEEIGYTLGIVYLYHRSPEHFTGVSITAAFLIPIAAIAAVNLLQTVLEAKVKGKLFDKYGNWGRWIYLVTAFVTTVLLFLGFYAALEHIGNMPGSFRTLMLLSLLSAAAHLKFCELFKSFYLTVDQAALEELDDFDDYDL